MLSERLGRWNVLLLLLAGFHLTCRPLHHLGLHGMPRRVSAYAPETGWGPMHHLATVGADLLFLAVVLFLFNVARTRRRGAVAGAQPVGRRNAGMGDGSIVTRPKVGYEPEGVAIRPDHLW